jgi:hypothetical protein
MAVTGQAQNEYVLVPRVPTPLMLEAAWANALAEDAAGVWVAMIRAWEVKPREVEIHSEANSPAS